MKLSSSMIMLFFLGYISCFGEITNLNNHFVEVQSFSDFEIEEQFKVINKPAVKIIKTTHGDTYGCVDFYKQPAFDHLSMKNKILHSKMHWKPSQKIAKINNEQFGFLWEDGIGCPIGTVPIRRVTKNELLRLKLFSKKYKPQGSWNLANNQNNVNIDQQHHFAVSRTKGEKGKNYSGATMIITMNNPIVKLPQFSSARMHFQIGDDFIQAGWIVNPKLYGDSKTRIFVYTKAGENQCYNSMCQAGVISVRSDIPLGTVVEPICVRGSNVTYYFQVGVFKDKANGNWVLEFGREQIGFWPSNRFRQSYVNNVEWGGEIYSAFMPSLQMGNGYFPKKDPHYDAFIFNITTINEKFEIDEWVKNTEIFSDNIHGYKVIERISSEIPVRRHIIYFGGPGNI